MANLVSTNNVPNYKLIASTIAGMVIPLYLAIAPIIHLPTFDPIWMQNHIEAIIAGVVAITAIVGYLKSPGPNDGVIEKK